MKHQLREGALFTYESVALASRTLDVGSSAPIPGFSMRSWPPAAPNRPTFPLWDDR
jgi:hypothetical protein